MTVPYHHQDTGDHHLGLIAAAAIVAVLLAVASLTILQVSFDGGGTTTERSQGGPSVVETASAEVFSPEKARAAGYAPTTPETAFLGTAWELPSLDEVRTINQPAATPVATGGGHPDIRTSTPAEAVRQGGGHPDIRTASVQPNPNAGSNVQ